MKKIIDFETWPRYEHYKHFCKLDYPYFNVTAHLDITELLQLSKKKKLNFFKAMVYFVCKTANHLPEFRQRIEDGQVVEYDWVHPSFTLLTQPELFSFCHVDYDEDSRDFFRAMEKEMDSLKGKISLDVVEANNRLYITSLPWVSFTSVTHPMSINDDTGVPRIGWGKYFNEGDRVKIPFSIQCHHGLMDGIHIGEYFEKIQAYLDHPEKSLHH